MGFGIKRRGISAMVLLGEYCTYLLWSGVQIFKRLKDNEKRILFSLEGPRLFRDDDSGGRYPFLMMNLFSEAGYNVYFYRRMNFKKYQNLCCYGKKIYGVKNLKILSRLPRDPAQYILAFDHAAMRPDTFESGWKKLVYLNLNKPNDWILGRQWRWIPYFMHIYQYTKDRHERVVAFRGAKKTMKILFMGNTNKDYYSNPNLSKLYGQMTRAEALKALFEMGDDVRSISDHSQLMKLTDDSADFVNRCLVFETNRFTIQPDSWFGVLSRADFFTCLSGTDLPMCHNAIESMALGVIPIIGYDKWFYPPLEHKKNALIFSNAQELKEMVIEALSMKTEMIAELRSNVIRYYEEHLADDSFVHAFETNTDRATTLVLQPQFQAD